MARFGVPSFGRDPLAYADQRLSGVPTVDSPRDPTVNDTQYPIQTIWRNNVTFRECMLVGFTAGQAQWRCFTDGDGSVLDFTTDDGNTVSPNAGVVAITGTTVANGSNAKPLFTDGTVANTIGLDIQLGAAVGPTPADANDAGLLSANNNQFVVDGTSGMFSFKGNTTDPAIQGVDVDFNTAPGVDPVVASASGIVSVFGNTVVNATNANSPVATHSRAVNQLHVDVQLGAAVAASPADPFDAGLLSADSDQFDVSANGFLQIKEPFGPTLGATNLGISYSSPTFTIHAADGSALSATNPAYVTVSSVTTGQLVRYKVITNYTFDDDSGTSDLTGNLWGSTTTVAWNNDIPFFIYAIAKDSDAAVTFGISRLPQLTSSPGAATFAISGSAVASTQGSMFGLDSGITVADYDSNPAVCLGSFRMRKNDAANDDWTVQALDNRDGFGKWHDKTYFNFPATQNGATSAGLSSSVGGDTIPTFQNVGLVYQLLRSGVCYYIWNWDNITVNGVGAGDLRWHFPLTGSLLNVSQCGAGALGYRNNGAGTYETGHSYTTLSFPTYATIIRSGTGTSLMTPADLTTDKKTGSFTFIYNTRTS